ncbi:hypothetical protein BB559_002051 [Furculomyces boomerangus]|uniref:asparaginase n=1 Tax=Furculomyces boomerangus TaxID=61424 RepID=A0A2T9YYM5_9FUNG|nr:hypothetical protein BB559_002262 [Furculomyces boomerangus]PVU97406.1 hypothetical protein BB559_002051 [Furculomyces boomerangus]
MADINKHFNESKTIRDILEAGDYNATIGLSKVLIIYTGGTIGMAYDDVKGYTPVDGYLTQHLKGQPRFYDQNGFSDLDQLERRTDTMAYTASALSFMLKNLGKTVIITGSQVPLSEVRNDAVENLLGALIIAGHYIIPEVTLFFNNKLFRGNRCCKVDSINFAAFESPNIPPLVQVGVNIGKLAPNAIAKFVAGKKMDPNVGTLRLFPGITEVAIRSFLSPPLKGVVLETYGSGNIPNSKGKTLELLKEASDRGVVIVNITQCYRGNVSALYETAHGLAGAGVVAGGDMTSECALTKLSYLVGCGYSPEKCRELMGQSLRGEMTLIRANQPSLIADPNVRATTFVQYISYEIIKGKTNSISFKYDDAENKDGSRYHSPSRNFIESGVQSPIDKPTIDFSHLKSPIKNEGTPDSLKNVSFSESQSDSDSNKKSERILNSRKQNLFTDSPRSKLESPILHSPSPRTSEPQPQLSSLERASIYRSFFPILLCSAASMNDIIGMRMLNVAAENQLETTCYDYNGRTPLHCASRNGNLQCVKWLVKNGASVHVLDRNGHTPLFDAVTSRRSDIVELLLEAGAHLSDAEHTEITALIHNAIYRCDIELLKLLNLAGFDFNKTDFEGRTPLHLAVLFEQESVVDYILGMENINPCAMDKLDKTPLDVAISIVEHYKSIHFMADSEDTLIAINIHEKLSKALN